MNIANESDEVGVARRLIPTILNIDLCLGLKTLTKLDFSDLGARRRLVFALEKHKDETIHHGLQQAAINLIDCCTENTDNLKKK